MWLRESELDRRHEETLRFGFQSGLSVMLAYFGPDHALTLPRASRSVTHIPATSVTSYLGCGSLWQYILDSHYTFV